MDTNRPVRLVEVGPRDGLQNEPAEVPLAVRLELVERLGAAGLREIETGSFVSPRAVPAMRDTAELFAGLERLPGVRYTALVPNAHGLAAARDAGVEDVAVFASVTDGFSRANLNAGRDEMLARFVALVGEAVDAGMRVRGYLSCVLGCPFDGDVAPADVVAPARALLAAGCHEISLGDTIGVGTAGSTARLLEHLLDAGLPIDRLALHAHDTWGQGLANVLVALQHGVRTIDAAVAGLGGCPYAPGARGNVATEDVIYLLDGLGLEHGADLERVAEAGAFVMNALGRPTASRAAAALAAVAARRAREVDAAIAGTRT